MGPASRERLPTEKLRSWPDRPAEKPGLSADRLAGSPLSPAYRRPCRERALDGAGKDAAGPAGKGSGRAWKESRELFDGKTPGARRELSLSPHVHDTITGLAASRRFPPSYPLGFNEPRSAKARPYFKLSGAGQILRAACFVMPRGSSASPPRGAFVSFQGGRAKKGRPEGRPFEVGRDCLRRN
jgi:hypothetical protein